MKLCLLSKDRRITAVSSSYGNSIISHKSQFTDLRTQQKTTTQILHFLSAIQCPWGYSSINHLIISILVDETGLFV